MTMFNYLVIRFSVTQHNLAGRSIAIIVPNANNFPIWMMLTIHSFLHMLLIKLAAGKASQTKCSIELSLWSIINLCQIESIGLMN